MVSQETSRLELLRLLSIFAALFFGLQWAYESAAGSVIERMMIDIVTVKPSAYLINWIAPAEQVVAQGHRLVSPQATLSVLNGCEGTESLFLIISAVLAFKTGWRHKLIGVFLGALIIFLVNQVRIAGLYFALRYDKSLFYALHSYIAPVLIVAAGAAFYYWWLRWPARISTNLIVNR
ncbi:MAG TPA: exosortase/archaeosortase family protein [Porticoccaceae bacterium]|nr:exosortase/archaeosortase family protein [Porticoccaceae bacterium]